MAGALRVEAPGLSYRQGVLLVLLARACWSIMGLGIRLMQEATVWQILFYRSLALAPILFIAGIGCWSTGLTFALPAHDITIALGLGVFQLGTGLTIFTIGSKVVPAAEPACCR